MMRTDRESKRLLIGLALVAALAMYAGLVRGTAYEKVRAQAVRDFAFGDTTVTRCWSGGAFELPVLFGLFPRWKRGQSPAVFGQNLPADRSENNSLIGFSERSR
jgi:hypothetical protein